MATTSFVKMPASPRVFQCDLLMRDTTAGKLSPGVTERADPPVMKFA